MLSYGLGPGRNPTSEFGIDFANSFSNGIRDPWSLVVHIPLMTYRTCFSHLCLVEWERSGFLGEVLNFVGFGGSGSGVKS
jgi:hypothetical protein